MQSSGVAFVQSSYSDSPAASRASARLKYCLIRRIFPVLEQEHVDERHIQRDTPAMDALAHRPPDDHHLVSPR